MSESHPNTSSSITKETEQMSGDEKYLFDLTGFLVVKDVLTAEQLELANAAINLIELQQSPEYFGESEALKGENASTRLGNTKGLMELEKPYCVPFWEMLAHPGTTPHLNTILGEGWRLDHGPGLIAMEKGCSGGLLHGNFDNAPYFTFVDKCKEVGIEAPIVPGLKILTSKRQLQTLPRAFHVNIPEALSAEIEAAKPEHVIDIGVEWAIKQSEELMSAGVPCVHFYIMQNSRVVTRVVEALRKMA